MIGEQQLAEVRERVGELDHRIDNAVLAIWYENSCAIPDTEQLGYLYQKLDGLHSARDQVNEIFGKLETGTLTPEDSLDDMVTWAINGTSPTFYDYFVKLGQALKRCVSAFFRFANSIYRTWKETVKQAYAGFRSLWRKLFGRIKGTERAKRPALGLPLEPLALAAEQAPGASSGVIRGEVRYMRRFL